MFIQLFAKYLVDQNVVSAADATSLLSEVTGTRVKMGTIAVADGLITEAQAEEINHIQTQQDRRFGDIAVEKGYLTDAQIDEIISKQGNDSMKFYQLLNEKANIPMNEIEGHVTGFQKSQGLTDTELEAVKADDYEKIVALFAPIRNQTVVNMVTLVMKNLTRFITNDFYFERIKKVENYSYSMLAGQSASGDDYIYLGFATEGELDGLVELAKNYAKGVELSGSEEIYDAICEFSNLNNGLLASEFSKADKFIDMAPPEVFLNQSVTGTAYTVPVYIKGKKIELVIIDNAAVNAGSNPHVINIAKADVSSDRDNGKKNVLVVDDSSLIRKVLRGLLESNGYNVIGEGVNGQDAVELYKQLSPDIVTLDVTMPVMDGVEALKQIMAEDPNAKVVMITAAGQQNRLMEALKIGAKLFVTKPFDENDLINNLNQI